MSGSTELSVLDRIQDPQQFVIGMGEMFAMSTMFGCKTKPQGIVLALHCLMTRTSPLDLMQTYHLIDGNKLSMKAEAMVDHFNERGGTHEILERTSECASVKLTNKHGVSRVFTLRWEDCKNEPFAKAKDGGIAFNYQTPLKRMQMLWARLMSDSIRATDPGAIRGSHAPEELDDGSGGVIEGQVVEPGTPGPSAPTAQSVEPAKRTRKAKEAADTSAAAPTVTETLATAPATSEPVAEKPIETGAAATVATPVEPEKPAAVTLPQIVTDICDLHDYVGPRWPESKGKWSDIWVKVLSSLSVPSGETNAERFAKANDAVRQKTLGWLNTQRVNVDKLGTSKDLNAFANQNPTTSATAAS